MTTFSFTVEEFQNWTMEGFPIQLINPQLFLESLKDYINDTNDNMFSFVEGSNLFIDGHDEDDFEDIQVLKVYYDSDNKKVKMVPLCINEDISDMEVYLPPKILGEAFLKVTLYLQTIVRLRKRHIQKLDLDNEYGKEYNEMPTSIKGFKSENKKYDPWPL